MKRIKNGGLEAAILSLVKQEQPLSEKEQERLDYLESLPKGVDVYLDDNGMQISEAGYVKHVTRNFKNNTNE